MTSERVTISRELAEEILEVLDYALTWAKDPEIKHGAITSYESLHAVLVEGAELESDDD